VDASESDAAELGPVGECARGYRDLPPCITKKGFLSEVMDQKEHSGLRPVSF
jgi:hypothetical protein